jgi:cell fate regulator YaaT (PSP1 superfamily)
VGAAALKKCGAECATCGPPTPPDPQGRLERLATDSDIHVASELRKAEDDVRRKVRERVAKHDLPMKISDAEWQWDRKKLTVYFTAENRVDFRNLVRDLAGLFRTRIELRQIGARDEAKRLTGVGRCGREYCCSSWLPELRPVSLSLAKDQRLSLNPSQISGGCGRLLCCLRYEHEFYVSSRKRFPKEGKVIATTLGRERVQAVDIFRERVLLKSEENIFRTVMLADLKREMGAPASAPAPAPEERALEPSQESATATVKSSQTDEAPAAAADEEPGTTPETRNVTKRGRRKRRRSRRRRQKPGKASSDQPDQPRGDNGAG